jgi:hypothetical protein
MNQELICELNLALIPEETLAKRHIALSKQMAKQYPAVIQLNGVTPRLAFTPIYALPGASNGPYSTGCTPRLRM